MHEPSPTPLDRLIALIIGNFSAPRGGRRILVALLYGGVCHAIFAVAVIAMIVVMYTGMTASFGRVPTPWSWAANLLLVLQFPLGHSFLLSKTGRRIISLFAKNAHAVTLHTTILFCAPFSRVVVNAPTETVVPTIGLPPMTTARGRAQMMLSCP